MKREGIPFDGFGSVLEMLRKADAPFREKILTNLYRRDPHLARRLEAGLKNLRSNQESSHSAMERGQRAVANKSYNQR